MKNLKISLLLICLHSCQTHKVFNIQTTPRTKGFEELHVIKIKSDRIIQDCYFFNAEDENNWRHQYSMYILNDKEEGLHLMQPTNQDGDTCKQQLKKISHIINAEPYVSICARNNLEIENKINRITDFGKLGNHRIIYKQLDLDSICNSKECFSNNQVWVNTCPGFVKNELD